MIWARRHRGRRRHRRAALAAAAEEAAGSGVATPAEGVAAGPGREPLEAAAPEAAEPAAQQDPSGSQPESTARRRRRRGRRPAQGGRVTGPRTARRIRLRTRRAAIGAVLAVALAAGSTGIALYGGTHGLRHGATAAAGRVRTQRTLLLELRVSDGTGLGAALLAHDPGNGTGAGVLLPPELLVPVPGAGTFTLGSALKTAAPRTSQDAVADLVGVTVDGYWVLDLPDLSQLVDLLGGIPATVDVPVLGGVRGNTLLVEPGAQQLDGPQAARFATYLAPGEPEQFRQARLQAVLNAILQALPPDQNRVVALLDSLRGGSASSESTAQIAALLLGLRADVQSSNITFESLPVIPIDLGDGLPTLRADQPAVQSLVDRVLAASVPAGSRSNGNRVLVLNGVGTPGLGDRVRPRLVRAGFVYLGSHNAPHFGYPHTIVLVRDATTAGEALGARVCRVLGVPVNVATTDLGSLADVVVIVGADYRG